MREARKKRIRYPATLSTRCTAEVHERVYSLADQLGVDVAELVRDALPIGLQHIERQVMQPEPATA